MDEAGERLTERLRAWLADHESVHEKTMFGGRVFMVNGMLLVSAGGDGDLLVRVDPQRSDELLAVDGTRQAEMGGRSMGPSWMLVTADAVATDEGLTLWMDVALSYNGALSARQRRPQRRSS